MNDFLTSNIHLTHIDLYGLFSFHETFPMEYPEKPYHSVNILTKGECSIFFYSGEILHLRANHFYYLPKDQPYQIIHRKPTELYTIVFDFLEEESKNYEPFSAQVEGVPRFLSNFQGFARAMHAKKNGYLNQCYQYFYTIINDIQQLMPSQYLSFSQREILNKAYSYIQENLFSPSLTVNHLCEILNVSPSYFREIFIKNYDLSPKKYILAQRFEHASSLLRNTSLKIQEISEQIGFNDATHFSTEFKKFFDVSPAEYRKCSFAIKPHEIIYNHDHWKK